MVTVTYRPANRNLRPAIYLLRDWILVGTAASVCWDISFVGSTKDRRCSHDGLANGWDPNINNMYQQVCPNKGRVFTVQEVSLQTSKGQHMMVIIIATYL
jgi:hypothetical protein